MTMHCFKNWQFEAKDNNEADAAVLCIMAQAVDGHVPNLNASQKQIIKEVITPPIKKVKVKKEES